MHWIISIISFSAVVIGIAIIAVLAQLVTCFDCSNDKSLKELNNA